MSEVIEAIQKRVSQPRLAAPAPDRLQLETLFRCAVRAPDHGRMRPWRFIVLTGQSLTELGLAFERAGLAQDPHADDAKRAKWRGMPLRAPMIIVSVARIRPNPKVPEWEQISAVSCATQNIQLAAAELGYGAMWRTGEMGDAAEVREFLGLAPSDRIVAFLYVGTAETAARPPEFQPLEECVEYRD